MRTDGRTDRQTDTSQLIVALRNFAKTPENNNFRNSSHKIEKNEMGAECSANGGEDRRIHDFGGET